VDHERSAIHRVLTEDDVAIVVDQDQVADFGMSEADREWIHPEVLGELGVAHSDVPGHAFAEADSAEDSQRAGELLLAMQALFLDGGKCWRTLQSDWLGREWYPVDHAGSTGRFCPSRFGHAHRARLGKMGL